MSFGGAGVTNPVVWTAGSTGGLPTGVVSSSSGIGIPGPHHPPASSLYGEDPGKPGMLEVVAGLSRDCFIIPLACVDRFLPAGLTVSYLSPIFINRKIKINILRTFGHNFAVIPLTISRLCFILTLSWSDLKFLHACNI